MTPPELVQAVMSKLQVTTYNDAARQLGVALSVVGDIARGKSQLGMKTAVCMIEQCPELEPHVLQCVRKKNFECTPALCAFYRHCKTLQRAGLPVECERC